MKESILSCLLAKYPQQFLLNEKKEHIKILTLDRNSHNDLNSASLNLTNFWKLFRPNNEIPSKYGESKFWHIDLIPKFIMAKGSLFRLLLKTEVSQYLEWKTVDGSFIFRYNKGGMFSGKRGELFKIPNISDIAQFAKSDIMGIFEKGRFKKFINFILDYDVNKQITQNGLGPNVPFKDFFKKYSLEEDTVELIGHVIALYTDDDYLEKKAITTIEKIKLYVNSFGKNGNSSFIYPVCGLNGISEGFCRIYSLNGGTYMFNRDLEEILYDENGKFKGIKSQGEEFYGKILITDPFWSKNMEWLEKLEKSLEDFVF